ncbi:hypothetical protein AB0I49_19775 [Streptomyces sp. NPDC050617]|uniref:hypothetical protein n=1 Tax=Streptomyces sp. NPDC050617 TaxID=3154628 RepID=UPI003431B4C3
MTGERRPGDRGPGDRGPGGRGSDGRRLKVSIAGSAARHAALLCDEAVPDAIRMSCVGNTVRIEVPEADFCVRLEAVSDDVTRLRFHVTFREDKPAGGTWWSSREIEVPAGPGTALVGRALAAEIRRSRDTFTHAVSEAQSLACTA